MSSSPRLAVLCLSLMAGCLGGCVGRNTRPGGPPGRAGAGSLRGTVVYANDLESLPVGPFTVAEMKATWNDPRWENGVAGGRVSIVDGAESLGTQSLRLDFPAGTFGPTSGGAQWYMPLPSGPFDELYCAYSLKFGAGFDFVKGGKLPGLSGGASNTGGRKPDGRDGWSARMMWRSGGAAVQYLYHPDQPGAYAQDFSWSIDGRPVVFQPGRWYRVEHRIVLNTPGQHDGIVQAWLDGQLALDLHGVRFRDVATLRIDTFMLVSFFGGNDATWAARKDESLYLDEFVISTAPIIH